MSNLSEKQFMAQVAELFRLQGFLVFHTHDSRRSEPGYPDLAMVKEKTGRLVYAELKVAKNRPTPAQEMWLAALKKSGVEVYVWYPEDFPEIVAVAERRAA